MDKKKVRNYQIFSVIFTFVLGSLLHFTFKLTEGNPVVAVFSSVNESTWEHLKLLFFPMLLTIIIGYFYLAKEKTNFLCAKTIGILASMLFTIIFFYTYTGILGKNIAVIDISSFFIAVIIGEYLAYRLINGYFPCNNVIAIIVLIVLTICFTIFTFYPPQISLFKDPITGTYGII